MSRRSGSSKQSERSKPESRTQESESDSGAGVDISPDELSINAGAIDIGINTEGELSLGLEIPTPVPGVTATGGIVINTETGEIEEVSLGAEIGQVTGFEVTIRGCNVITTFYVEIPNTNIRFSYDVISELPNCKIEEDDNEEEPPEEIPDPFEEEPDQLPPLDPDKNYIALWWWNTFTYMEGYESSGNIVRANTRYRINIGSCTRTENRETYTSGNLYPGINFNGWGLIKFSESYIESGSETLPPRQWSEGYTAIITQMWEFSYYEPNPNLSSNSRKRTIDATTTGIGYKAFLNATTGDAQDLTNFFNSFSSEDFSSESGPAGNSGGRGVRKIKIYEYPTIETETEKNKPKPQPPKKMDKCCRESLMLLEEIHKALGCEELLDRKKKTGGFEVPKRLLAPGGKGEIKHHNYLEIFESMIRIQDHLGVHPFQVKIKDLNAAVAGDQGAEFKFLSATAALEKIVYLLTDTEADGDTQTNMLVRLAFVCTNILTALSTVSRDVETVRDGLGIGFKSKRERVDVPFDVSCGQNDKGFDPKKKKQIDLNEEDSTEALLPYLLRTKNHWIRTTEFDDKDDIKDLLIKILYSLKGRT